MKKNREKISNTDNKATVKKLLKRLGDQRGRILLSLLLALISTALTLGIPVLVGKSIDCVIGAGMVDFAKLKPYLALIGLFAALSAAANYLMGLINNRISFAVTRSLREEAFNNIHEMPLSELDPRPIGDTVSRIIGDADQLSDGLLIGFSNMFTGVITIIGTIVFMLLVEPIITLAVVLLSPISLLIARFIANGSYKSFRMQTASRGENTAIIDEFIGEQKLIRAYAYEKKAEQIFEKSNEELKKNSIRAVFLSSLTNPVTRFVNSIIYASVAVLGALSVTGVIGGALTVGGLSAFLNYANQYTKPFNEISGVIAELQGAIACAQRLFEIIEAKRMSDECEQALPIADGAMEFSSVTFSYSPDRELIKDFSLKVRDGQRIAIVGPTGCGKTTLINLIMRFYDVDAGEISLGGVRYRDMCRKQVRAHFGMVLQDTWLKAGTVKENIRMGSGASDEEIIEAAKAAHAHGFISRLSNGYDTVLKEGGGALSQGQKQLLCIARVMLSKPHALILDEATSSIDTRTEVLVQDAFSKLMQGRTSFIVAHRLSTVRDADMILVMKDGSIIEQGRHDELIERGGFYKELYDTQFAGVQT